MSRADSALPGRKLQPLSSAETIIVAIGQKPEWATCRRKFKVQAHPGDSRPLTLQTRRPKIFAAGDLVSSPRSVIEAMAPGRKPPSHRPVSFRRNPVLRPGLLDSLYHRIPH
jgi:hypothetical protein